MQLALENKKVTAATEAYLKKLSNIVDGKSDVVRYAYAINGKVNSAEVYASHEDVAEAATGERGRSLG